MMSVVSHKQGRKQVYMASEKATYPFSDYAGVCKLVHPYLIFPHSVSVGYQYCHMVPMYIRSIKLHSCKNIPTYLCLRQSIPVQSQQLVADQWRDWVVGRGQLSVVQRKQTAPLAGQMAALNW